MVALLFMMSVGKGKKDGSDYGWNLWIEINLGCDMINYGAFWLTMRIKICI